EHYGDRWTINELVEDNLIDYSRVTLPNSAGITEFNKLAAVCETHYVGLIPHFTGTISTAALVHACGSAPNPVYMEMRGDGPEPEAHLPIALDFRDGDVLRWSTTGNGATVERDEEYVPTIYVSAEGAEAWPTVADRRAEFAAHPQVVETRVEQWRRGFRHDAERVLAVDVEAVDAVSTVARQIAAWERAGTLRLYNVDFSPGFRYCLETDTPPETAGDLSTLELAVPPTAFADEGSGITEARIGGEGVSGPPVRVLDAILDRVEARDPDVLILSTARIVPELFETAAEHGIGDVALGRRPGYRQLAGRSTYESYGQVGHSPARYSVPGRAIVDESNTFFYGETNLAGCLDLVERSWKPLQELAWASIGNVLTAMQIREARDRNVLVPWRSWRHERFKTMGQLHDADRGGHTLSPDVGFHEDVHELDFASLYPNIIRTRNVSPETIRCGCHDTEDVPELGYSVCEERGYLPDVLGPLIDDRAAIKAEIREADDPDRRAALQGKSDAIKWILVSCFGYQGFSNAKFGRIEAHEAINAYARDILLTAKERLEAAGWRLRHGIVDSLWVTAREDEESRPLRDVASDISDEVGIDLEYEAAYDWVAFVPLRTSDEGALTSYFGRYADPSDGDDDTAPPDERFKYRGIECRQRSTSEWVASVQEDLIAVLDETRDPAAVCDRLRSHLTVLETGQVDPARLAITNRVSKRLAEYCQHTRNAAALERSAALGLERFPGQDVQYVVVDDEKASRERVRLLSEEPATYDRAFYRERTLRAARSVLAPLGWDRERIEDALAEREDGHLGAFS
ncbi:MAG: type B DNA-directed DNA polymerase, partial [Halolamina sp.]